MIVYYILFILIMNSYLNQFDELDSYFSKNFLKNNEDVDLKKCVNCNSVNSLIYDYNTYNKICKLCGSIDDTIRDESAEWRFYGASDSKGVDPSRCGGIPINNLLPKSSMGTTIGSGNSKFKSIRRLQKWNQISTDERSDYEVFKKIDIILKKTQVNTKIINDAKLYYKMLSEKNDDNTNIFLTRGKNRNALIVACLYISSKNNNKPFKEEKILENFNISKSDLTRGLKKFALIERTKNISINNNNVVIYDLIEYYGKQFNFSNDIVKILYLVYIRSLKINILKNSNPKSICSGLLFFISYIFKLNVNKKNIIKIIQISEVTLNKIFNVFLTYEKVLLIGFNTIDFINMQ